MRSNYEKNRDNWLLFSSQNKITAEDKRWARIRKDEMQEEWYCKYLENEYGKKNPYNEFGRYLDIYEGE